MQYASRLSSRSFPRSLERQFVELTQRFNCTFPSSLMHKAKSHQLDDRFTLSVQEIEAVRKCNSNLLGWVQHNLQWFKLKQAFALMEAHEHNIGTQYDMVIRTRFDVIPLPQLRVCQHRLKRNVLYALTDMVFFGSRSVMAVVARATYTNLSSFFVSSNPDPYHRPVDALHYLDTWDSQPREAFDMNSWRFYNKIATLPYADMGAKSQYANMVLAAASTSGQRKTMRMGEMGNSWDMERYRFS